MPIKVYVCVQTNPGQTKNVYAALKKVPGVVQCHEVIGPYDIVAELEVANLTDVPPILSQRVRTIPGIDRTTSLVTFPE